MDDDTLICYVLMRTDLDSLNTGKAIAQGHHNFGALKKCIRANVAMQPSYIAWQETTEQDFGTVITLGGNERGIEHALSLANRFPRNKVVAGWVWDDSYPLRDGEVTHSIRLNTNAFVFGTKGVCADIIGHLGWHP